jgi:hypothetical protein
MVGRVKKMSGNRLPWRILDWEPEGTWRKGRPKERWMDVGRSMTDWPLIDRREY